MANQELYGKTYRIPPEITQAVNVALMRNPTGNGIERAKNIVKNGYLTYQAMKRMKHDMQGMDKNDMQYHLAGGQQMEAFIDKSLNQDRAGVERSKEVMKTMPSTKNQDVHAFQASPRLNEAKKKLDQNAVGVIVNSDNKILLLKRGPEAPWMPNKWALVGGGIEKGESAEEACKREIKEETGLEIEKFVESFTINKHGDSEETLFACRYSGEDTDIELDKSENTQYGWYTMGEMEYLDIVPHLIEYITMVFKKYD